MEQEILPDPGAVALRAAERIARIAREAAAWRGWAALSLSGGSTPWRAFRVLAEEDVPWERVHLFQTDERIAPAGDPDRNSVSLTEALTARVPIPPENVHFLPVEASDLEEGARRYEAVLRKIAGSPPVLDLVQLGLGEDGHTASLFPGDPVLEVVDREVAVTALHRGRRRMTLTFPPIDRARNILWLVTGADKAAARKRLIAGDRSIPAGRVRNERAVLLSDIAAR